MSVLTRWLCNHSRHDYSAWWISDDAAGYGLKPIIVRVQKRQCVRKDCLYTQIEQLMVKMQ